MNVPTLTMPADLAQEKYEQYKAALDDREATEEDERIMLGYKALAAGKQILDLFTVMQTGPVNEKGFPRLAVARAHWQWCHHREGGWGEGSGRMVFSRHEYSQCGPSNIVIPRGHAPNGWRVGRNIRALVPIIPLPIRPKAKLQNFHILFEAEWQPVSPKDPLLLRRLSGSLYVILAAWDLTELERSVLNGRFAEPK